MAPPLYKCEWKLREIFNTAILPRIETGEVQGLVVSDKSASPQFGQPPGTRSQMVAYYEVVDGKIGPKIAEAHRYLLPDGTLGGSGKRLPDPKSLKHEGRLYVVRRQSSQG
jgi:hypothetical protein